MSMRLKLLLMLIVMLAAGGMLYATDRVEAPTLQSSQSQFVTPVESGDISSGIATAAAVKSSDSRANYNCWLRIYFVEPVSRWADNTHYYYYEFGFLDFGLDTALSIPYLGTYETTRTWTCPIGLVKFDSSNIEVMAAVFNQESGGTGYSNPPSNNPFTIHAVDASAAAIPGVPGYNTSDATSTHTVFVEEATATT